MITVLKLVSSEGAEFKINDDLLFKYSSKAKQMFEHSKNDTLKLTEVDT